MSWNFAKQLKKILFSSAKKRDLGKNAMNLLRHFPELLSQKSLNPRDLRTLTDLFKDCKSTT